MKQPDIITHVIPDLTAAFFRKRDIVFEETVDIGIWKDLQIIDLVENTLTILLSYIIRV